MKCSATTAGLALDLSLFVGDARSASDLPGSRGAEFPSAQNGLLPVPANRIVGLWRSTVSVGPCAGGPCADLHRHQPVPRRRHHERYPIAPVNARGPGMGVWRYLGGDRYKVRFQFNRYADNQFVGIADIRADAQLRAGGIRLTYDVRATQYNAYGSVLVEVCGSSDGQRVDIHD